MNRNLYRIVFNAARGQLMAVAENVAARRRGSDGKAPSRVRGAAFAGLAIALTMASTATAQIVAYRNAPGSQRPTILATGNGVPLVNIQTPSAAGVSHNAYSQFDVTPGGAILNNSRSAANTELAGWISGNPWLAAGSARLILNEVVSSNPSLLNGYVEVAGTRAEVVIANPAGISCAGCGFINAQRATLTTGTPRMRSGALDGYRVAGGTIHVAGAGLDASGTDYTELIARTVKIDAAIHARTLSIRAGNGEVGIDDASDAGITAFAATAAIVGAESANEAAIDVAELGGMYAGKIRLVATGTGIGVRNTGTIAASIGDVVVSSDGRLQNGGQISAAAGILTNSAGVDNSGTIAASELRVDSRAQTLNNTGGTLAASATLAIASGALTNDAGLIEAGGALTIDTHSEALRNTNTGTSLGIVGHDALSIVSGDLDNTGAYIGARGTLRIASAALINSDGATLRGDGDVELSANRIDNRAGTLFSGQRLTISSGGTVDNSGGLIAAADSVTLADAQAKIVAGAGASPARTLELSNSGGTLIADRSLAIDAARVGGDGTLASGGELSLRLLDDYTHSGQLIANGNATIETAGYIDNRARMQATGRLDITAASINNAAAGEIIATSLSLAATDDHTLTNLGLIDAGDALIESPTIDNVGSGRIYGDHLAIAATTLSNRAEAGNAPLIAARVRLDIGVTQLVNTDNALIVSLGDLAIGGELDAYRRASGRSETIDNHAATIDATGELTISAKHIVNRNANLTTTVATFADQHIVEYQGSGAATRYAEGTAGVYVFNDESDQLTTPAGKYEDWLRYDYTRSTHETQLLHNDPGRLLADSAMRLNADTLLNDNSEIIAGGALTAQINTLSNLAASGERITSDSGSVTSYWRDHDKGRDSTGSSTAAYAPPATIETITLGTSVYRQNAAASGITTTIAAREPAGRITEVSNLAALSVRSIASDFALPDNVLFHTLAADSASRFLVESDARLTAGRAWLSSDYLLEQLIDPATLAQKRLGDGYYEQRLIREQVARLSGQRFLAGHAEDEAQYRALMDAALPYAARWQLIPGVALSAEQMAQLTSDIVWLVEQDITLADGAIQRVLVPRVYALATEGEPPPASALIAAKTVELTLSGDLHNTGSIANRQRLMLDAENVHNTGGRISADEALVSARGDLENLGGTLYATDTLIASAGNDLTVASTTRSQSNAQGSRTNIDRVGRLMVGASQGTLVASTGNDLTLLGAVIENATPASYGSEGSTTLLAGGDIVFGTVRESNGQSIVWDGQNQRRDAYDSDVGTTLRSAGDIAIQAGHDLSLVAANIGSERGALDMVAGNDLRISAGRAGSWVDEAHQHSESGLLSHTTRSRRDTLDASYAVASTLSAESATISAGRELRVVGSNVVANADVTLRAAGDVIVEAANEIRKETHFNEVSKSGLFGSGGIGFTLGSRQQSTEQTFDATTATASAVGSITGDVVIESGKNYRQVGSDVVAVDGSVDIAAQRVDIVEAREPWRETIETRTRQSGLTIAITSPVISAVQTVQRMHEAGRATDDPRLRALAAASGALALKGGVDALVAGQGKTIDGKANQMPTFDDKGEVNGSRDATAGERAGGVNLSISIGGSSSRSTTTQTGDNAAASTLTAGQDIHIAANGSGGDSDLLLRGARLSAGRDITLTAADQIDLLAAANTAEQNSKSSGQSASVGFSIGTNGLLFNVGASMMRGRADGSDTTWSNSTIDAGSRLTLTSGGDTRLVGAVARGERVIAEVGGGLEIASLQDTSSYTSKQQAGGFSVSIGMGRISGSLSLSRSKIDSNYASVVEQSGIQTGDGGFHVNVGGDTALTGAVIASTQAAVDAKRNAFATAGTLTLSDIENHADYQASSASINLGSAVSFSGSLPAGGIGTSAGFGKDSGSASATTRSGISGIAGNRAVRTGDAAGGIAPIFDADKVQSEIDAQTQITQTFGQLASQAVGDYAASQLRESAELRAQATTESDAVRRNELEVQANKLQELWGDQGSLRLAAHTLVGGLTGGASGAAGAATGTLTAPLVAEQLSLAGIEGPLATTLTALASTAAGATVGGVAGAGTAFNEAENNYLYHYKGRIIAYDRNNNDKIVALTSDDFGKLAARNPDLLMQVVAGLGQQGAPILVPDDSAMMATGSRVLDLSNAIDREQIARETDMGYINLSDQNTRVYVQTGMANTRSDAGRSAQLLSELLKQPVGYINNGTEGLTNDVGEYLPDSLGLKDVLNEYTYRTLNAKGSKLIVLHSAGNEDARKAMLAGSLYGHHYEQLSFVSLASPVGAAALQTTFTRGGAKLLGQINDWKDPITYSKSAIAVSASSLVSGLVGGMTYGAIQGCSTGLASGPLGCFFAGGVGATVGGIVGLSAGGIPFLAAYGAVSNYHVFDRYIANPKTQRLLLDWQRANP